MHIDQENLSESVYKLAELCIQMEAKRDYETASEALLSLSIMKLIIGSDKFDELPSFSRWLRIADNIVAERDKEKS